MTTSERILYLLDRVERRSATVDEVREIAGLIDTHLDTSLQAQLAERPLPSYPATLADTDSWLPALREILAADKLPSAPVIPAVRRFSFFRPWMAAASALLILGIGIYLWTSRPKNTVPVVATVPVPDIAPGKDGAVLTLADGSQVVLDSLGNGVIASQSGSQVVLKNGELVYDLTGKGMGETVYNTMTTPKGRQFILLLPDGTKVWLNAASSIRYPTVFSGKERKVEVTGEAYFEVAQHAQQPFRVNVHNQAEVEVLGTHFNVNAYIDEESIHTTLLEGMVRVRFASNEQLMDPSDRPGKGVVLKPGQQAQIKAGQPASSGIIVLPADINKVMAWKNGLFNFEGLTLTQVMHQLERWYNIEVQYKGKPTLIFRGEMYRNVPLSKVLEMLTEMGAQFEWEGKDLIVL